jgi:AraC-like DNA-binding protein
MEGIDRVYENCSILKQGNMQHGIDWVFILVFMFGTIGLMVSAILFIGNKNESFSARILAAYLFCASIILLNYNLSNTTFFLDFPHLWRTVAWASFCAPPLAYLYVRTVLEQEFRFRNTDFIFFLPAVIYMLTMTPFLILDTAGKLEILRKLISDRSLIPKEPEGSLPQGLGFLFRTGFGLVMALAQYAMLAKTRRRILLDKNLIRQNLDTFNWLFYFTLVVSLSYLLLFVETVLHVSSYINLNQLIILTISANVFFICTYLLIRPNILYGMTGWMQVKEKEIGAESDLGEENSTTKQTTLSLEQKMAYKIAIQNHFLENQPFLQVGYKIKNLSNELDIPGYQLSAFINQEYGKNFNELINDQRVDYLEEMLQSKPENFQYTLEALGNMAGFNSRSAFIAAVKKKTGKPPVEHFQHLRNGIKG